MGCDILKFKLKYDELVMLGVICLYAAICPYNKACALYLSLSLSIFLPYLAFSLAFCPCNTFFSISLVLAVSFSLTHLFPSLYVLLFRLRRASTLKLYMILSTRRNISIITITLIFQVTLVLFNLHIILTSVYLASATLISIQLYCQELLSKTAAGKCSPRIL